MLVLEIPKTEMFDNDTETFYTAPLFSLSLEHSLIAISKWEERYKVPFLKNVERLSQPKHYDKFLQYINCMSTKGEIPMENLLRLDADHFKQISEYIADPHSATIPSGRTKGGGKPLTSERIYAAMAGFGIPDKYAQWHLNRLLMVINICGENNEDPSKRKPDNSATDAYIEQNEQMRRAGMDL